jgi:hypothetical protein
MGGKSTLLRQTCLAALLAHVGAWVPAQSLRLSPVDALFVRMGGAVVEVPALRPDTPAGLRMASKPLLRMRRQSRSAHMELDSHSISLWQFLPVSFN